MTTSSNYITNKHKSQDAPQKYEITIGIECHVQLATKTKLFSEVDNDARDKEPNTCLSPVDFALPGMLPRLNEMAVRLAVRAGLAMNADVNRFSRFDRKHYYYPDLPKGYQISQLYQPIIGPGHVELPDGTKIRIEHAHLEEDAGKLTHESGCSLVDLNRAGTPLIEIVSMPDIHSAAHAHDYCKELWRIMTYAGVTLGDLYNGNMRFDVNISLAKPGAPLGTRAEIKNLNSFRSVERAVEYEYQRQSALLDKGERVVQETRGWSDATGQTTSQRSKEEAQDYRYMPEPDLPPLNLSVDLIDAERQALPALPADYRARFKDILAPDILETLLDYQPLMAKLAECEEFGERESAVSENMPREDASERESVVSENMPREGSCPSESEPPVKTGRRTGSQKLLTALSNLFASALLAEEKSAEYLNDLPTAKQLVDLVNMNEKNELSSTSTKEVFLRLFDPQMKNKSTREIAGELNLLQENDTAAIEKIVAEVLAAPENAKAVSDYKNGQEKVLGFLVGQVMKASRGKANPALAQQILRQNLQ